MSYAAKLVAEILASQGLPEADAPRVAECLLDGMLAAQIIHRAVLDAWDRDAHIYHLRGQRLTAVVIGQRVGLCRSKVFQAIHRHTDRRRAALRLVS